jgi:isopentenyl diphosphate isomerase/L-lactate dehydrogenase-like FMN-dependent dehydrogenase
MTNKAITRQQYAEREFLTLHEFVHQARINLPQTTWDYLIGGTETETTVRRNREGLDRIAFRPRVLRDVSDIDASGVFLGKRLRIPVLLAPIGSVESFAEGGGATAAMGAEEFGVDSILSSACVPGLEEVAASVDEPMIFQLYVRGDDDFVDDHARRATDAGYRAFCITVDTAVYSRRERDVAKRYLPRGRARATGNFEFQAAFDWKKVARFKERHSIPLILKGIATAEDALIACEHGVEVIYVSNHGGRQLDHGRGAIEVLPEIVEAAAGRAEIVVDGGFLRGTDVVKAIALGADAVGIGRLQGYALAAGGQRALVRMLELLEDEMLRALGLLGLTRLDDLDRSYVHLVPPVGQTHVTSAFPHLDLNDPGY